MAAISTKQKLLQLIEDTEIISKEIFELMSTPKQQQRADAPETQKLMELLVLKDKEIKENLKIAAEQAEIQKTVDELKTEVDKRDTDIRNLQKNLKEAETILSTAIYQAKQKLEAIRQANNKTISSEELIKFAHKISASNAVASPPTWTPGDPRRPYPTDFEMRLGFLGKCSGDLPINGQQLQSQGSYGEPMSSNRTSAGLGEPTSASTPSSVSSWQPPPELHHSLSTGSGGASGFLTEIKGHNKENEDVGFMSSDSSSSSSSDE
ncbi:mediator of RNA polymerase II transcription subunit 4-like [Mizuhopecten yessoensis]|uniref:Mediator of RNA polymerase II transcription subunit 4 n=1 Tax=Mizuhopecten yessoensis TaxID=6573 RepID=A0A210PVC5_MIZYE|nr:mediator of RNA polymerase II transcription subunit 4-like [Mizuhopecten yessoensis]OWF40443.1 Mediator of RNA polymerase II transcription subunit 4 [Mizuhopecten yessoensis]